jgi:hypothetical protein
MPASEHILLESDDRKVPDRLSARKVHARVGLESRLRRRGLQLEIIDYYFLAVRSWRARAPQAAYVLDLRFVDATPRFARHIAWRSLATALLLMTLAAASAAWAGPFTSGTGLHNWLVPCLTAMGLATLAILTCAYRTKETVTVYSVNGRARLLEYTGGLGTSRSLRLFNAKLAAHIQLAAAERRRSRSEYLRDEMREHFRLKELGILSMEEYEAAKARILSQHDH